MDESFRPAVLANRIFRRQVEAVGVRLVIGLERSGGEVSRFETGRAEPDSQVKRRIAEVLEKPTFELFD